MSAFSIRTERQTLRLLVPDDAEAMFRLNADPAVRRYVVDAPLASVADQRASLEAYQDVYRDDGFARWAAIETATGELIGWCGLRRQADGEVDIGYRYQRASWGRGLATEAARACVDYGFAELALPRIIGLAHAENIASIRVLEKLGLRFEKSAPFAEGVPGVVWALSRDEWSAR